MNRLSLSLVALFLTLGSGFHLPAYVTVTPPGTVIPLVAPRAHVYVVYSGVTHVSTFTSAHGLVKLTKTLYLVTDLARPTNFSLLAIGDKTDPGYHLYTRILSPDGTYVATYDDGKTGESDPGDNFLANVIYSKTTYPPIVPLDPVLAHPETSGSGNAIAFPFPTTTRSGEAVFKFSLFGTDSLSAFLYPIFPLNPVPLSGTTGDTASPAYVVFPFTHTYPRTAEAYATGTLTGLSPQALQIVIPATSGQIQPDLISSTPSPLPPYQVNAITTPYYNYIGTKSNASIVPFAAEFSGTGSYYDYDATLVSQPQGNFRALAVATNAGTVTLTLNPTLSALANVGGSYEVPSTGQVSIPLALEIQPVASPLDFTHRFTNYEGFLYHLLLSLGKSTPGGYVPGHSSVLIGL